MATEISYILGNSLFKQLPSNAYFLSLIRKFKNNKVDQILQTFPFITFVKKHKQRLSKKIIDYEFNFNNGFSGNLPADLYECYMDDIDSCITTMQLKSIKNLNMNSNTWTVINLLLTKGTTDCNEFIENKLNISADDLITLMKFLEYLNIQDEDSYSEKSNFWYVDVNKIIELNSYNC
jgi:hypothetical protein